MQRTNDFIKGLAGLTITTALLLGLPVALLATIGWPLPTAWPGIDTISRHITDGDIPDAFLIKLIACVVWIVWAQIAAATVLEYMAIVQGKVSTRTPVMPGVRLLAAKLATWTTLLLSAFAPIRPAMAAPLQPVPALTAMAAAAPTAQPDLVPEAAGSRRESMVAEARYQTVRGDTWWDISEGLLGDGMRWNDIRTLNIGSTQPDGTTITEATETVRAGWALAVPLGAQLPSANPAAGNEVHTVTVEKGDHFWSIAEDTLAEQWGREATDTEVTPYWVQLVEANEGKLLPPGDPDMIYPDQEFVLPAVPANPDIAPDLNGNHVIDPPEVVLAPAEPEEAPVLDAETPAGGVVDAGADQAVPGEDRLRDEPVPAAPNPGRAAESGVGQVIDDLKPIAATAGALALLGGTLLFTLRRLRGIQAARRRPGTVIDPPPDGAANFEQRIRAISTDGEDVRYIAAANDYLSHKLENASTPIPSVIAVRAGQFGLELLLDEPCEPVEGFHAATPDKTAWRLNADLDVRMMEAEAKGDAHPFAPALCVVGATEAGSLLVDLEQLGALSIEGSPIGVADFQRGLLASTCVAPWATQCEIVALGIDGLAGDELSRATTPTAPKEWAAQMAIRMRQEAANLDRSPYEERIDHGIVLHPMIVFIGPNEDFAGIAHHLAPVANLAYSPLAIVSAHPLPNEYRIVLEESAATLEPFGLTFEPVSVTPIDLEAIDQLIANASDTSTSPPAAEWADEMADHETATQAVNGAGEAVGDIDLVAIEGTQNEVPPPAVELVSTGPSAQALESIAEILKPRPIEVHILGRHPRIEGVDGEPTPKIEAIITYLAFHREVAGQRLRDEFWPGATSRQGCDNAISRVRALLGDSDDGTARLETKRATHSYRISDDIGLDWHRAEQLVAASKGQPLADEAAYLDAACELIDARVAADASPANYGWLLREPTIYTLIETTLVDAAHRRGELALAAGDSERTDWAARKGLAIVEGQEAMYRMRMEAASEAGDLDGVNSAYREARRAAESYGYDEEVQPETQALFEKLTRAGRDARSSDSAVR
jgi:nucleoid-associated protein YgaU